MTELCNDNKYGQPESQYTKIQRDISQFLAVQMTRDHLQKKALKMLNLQIDGVPDHQLLDLSLHFNFGYGGRGLLYAVKASKRDPCPPFPKSPNSSKVFHARVNQLVSERKLGFLPVVDDATKTTFWTCSMVWAKGLLSVLHDLCSSP